MKRKSSQTVTYGIKELALGICIKIVVYKGSVANDVIYYRHSMKLEQAARWKWYFNYLVARVKVKHPKLRVELRMCAQTMLAGEAYKQKKIKDLLKFYYGRLHSLERKPVPPDLFGEGGLHIEHDKKRLQAKIDTLEQGIYDGYVPVEYINKIKQYI